MHEAFPIIKELGSLFPKKKKKEFQDSCVDFVTILTVADCSVEFYLCQKVGVAILLAFCIYGVSILDTLLVIGVGFYFCIIFGVMICLGIFYALIYFPLLQIKGATILEYICRHNDVLHQCQKLIFIGSVFLD